MTSAKVFDEPTTVTPEGGDVVLQGPGGLGLSMTPGAAEETGRRLKDGADTARGQSPTDPDLGEDEPAAAPPDPHADDGGPAGGAD